MKQHNTFISAIVLLVLNSALVRGQEFKYQENLMSVVFEVDSVKAKDIHSRALSSIANTFKSANDVIQLNDKDANKIVVNGSSSIITSNPNKEMWPNIKAFPDKLIHNYRFNLNIDSKDGRYRLLISLSEFDSQEELSYAENEYLTFEEVSKSDIEANINSYFELPGWGLVSKKKKEIFVEAYQKYPSEVVEALKEDVKAIALILNDAIQSDSVSGKNSLLNEDF